MFFRISMMWNAVEAFGRALFCQIFRYRFLTTPAEQQERLNECEACDQLTEERQCRDCGCFVDAKTMLAPEQCPRKKWLRIMEKKSVKPAAK